MPEPTSLLVDRNALAAVFKDQRTMLAFEAVMRAALVGLPSQVAGLDDAGVVVTNPGSDLTNARVLTGGPGVTIDDTTPNLVSILVNVLTILGYTPARSDEPFVTTTASGTLSAERVLTGSTGVTIGVGTPGQVIITVNVPTALGYTPADAAGQVFSGNIEAPNIETGGLVLQMTPAASGTASTHSVPVNCNGTFYYIRLSTTP